MKVDNITLETTDKVMTSKSGLILFEKLWKMLDIKNALKRACLRSKGKRASSKRIRSNHFFFPLRWEMIAFLTSIPLEIILFFYELVGGHACFRTMGDFLRSFGRRHIKQLQDHLLETALKLRLFLHQDNDFILSMDSTPHTHYAKKMEGLGLYFKNLWCLDSQNAYDQFGYSYLFDLRAGNTFSGKQAEQWIHHIFKRVPGHMDQKLVQHYASLPSTAQKNAVIEVEKHLNIVLELSKVEQEL